MCNNSRHANGFQRNFILGNFTNVYQNNLFLLNVYHFTGDFPLRTFFCLRQSMWDL
jgi:hypothetical protein